MMKTLKIENCNVECAVSQADIAALKGKAAEAMEKLHKGNGAGNDFLGWLNLPGTTDEALIADIELPPAHCRVVSMLLLSALAVAILEQRL